MAAITTKFSVGEVCYTFDSKHGIIFRNVVQEINMSFKLNDTEVAYKLTNTVPVSEGRVQASQEYEQNLYSEAEVKDLANTWLINKSVSIFSQVGL